MNYISTEEKSFFWELIKNSNKKIKAPWNEYSIDEHIEELTELLSEYDKEKIITFEKVLLYTMDELYTGEIADLYLILECEFTKEKEKVVYDTYISDDGFIYFRCWLILKGKEFIKEISESIKNFINGKYSFDLGDTWAEGLLYVANDAFNLKKESDNEFEISDIVAKQFPDIIHYDSIERTMKGEPTDGDQLQIKYPELVAEMSDLLTQNRKK